jgi:hypothetical protein
VNETTTAREVTWGDRTYALSLSHPWVTRSLTYRGLPGPNGNTVTACLSRFDAQNYSTEDVERVLELGLIGGGMSEREADRLLDQYVRGKPLASNAAIAIGLLAALFLGKTADNG